jgi:hypothetical protein
VSLFVLHPVGDLDFVSISALSTKRLISTLNDIFYYFVTFCKISLIFFLILKFHLLE